MAKSNIEQLQKELTSKGYDIKLASQIKQEAKIKTGIFALDYVLSGGISQCEGGHRLEFFGSESTGKTTFALHIIKKYQELGKSCLFIDAERAYDKSWGEIIGINNKDLMIVMPESLEQMGDLFKDAIPQMDLIVVDSIVSLIPLAELERDTSEPQMAVSARVNALITRKIYNALKNTFVTIIFINQIREKVSMVYGSPYTTAGGHALRHLYNSRIEFKLGKPIEKQIEGNKEKIGYNILLNCVKNKKGNPGRVTSVEFYFNGYINNKISLLFAGIKYGIIEQHGGHYLYNKTKEYGQEKFINKLKDEDWVKIEKEIWERIK